MDKIQLGKTGLWVTKTAFGALPIQRKPVEEAVKIIRKAYESGINYFDTANAYTDSEYKLGLALHDVRENIVISTKTGATDKETALKHIQNSLKMLQTDYIDIIQLHNPASLDDLDNPNSAYAACLEAKEKGWVRHIGMTNHSVDNAFRAIESGKFETVQYPFSYISSDREIELVRKCKEENIGFIAMKGLCGGMLSNSAACFAWMQQFDNVANIWGIQHEWELDEWLDLDARKQQLTPELWEIINRDKKELAGNFCRSCGYCLPCPADIDIPQAARMAMLLRRSPYQPYMNEEFYQKMHRIDNCLGCHHCSDHCPYHLDTPSLLKYMLKDFDEFYAEHKNEGK